MAAALMAVSILLSVVWVNLIWFVRSRPAGSNLKRLRQLATFPGTQASYEFLRLVFYLGLPYVALLNGWLDIRAMGLGYLDWPNGLRWTVLLSLAAWSMLMFVWVPYLRATANLPIASSGKALTWARRIVEAVYLQAHWAFYRAVCILLLSGRFDQAASWYWGTAAGLGFVFLEGWLDPRVRRNIARVGEGEMTVWNAAQAIINAVGFYLSRNVWLLALVHLALEFTVPHLKITLQPSRQRRGATTVDAVAPR